VGEEGQGRGGGGGCADEIDNIKWNAAREKNFSHREGHDDDDADHVADVSGSEFLYFMPAEILSHDPAADAWCAERSARIMPTARQSSSENGVWRVDVKRREMPMISSPRRFI
jgi:hypothetical protein